MARAAGTGTRAAARSPALENRLLSALPEGELARLQPHFERVQLAQATLLHEPDEEIEYVYFPVRGVASLMGLGSEGEEVDTAMIGTEGMVGLPVFLGTRQMPVKAIVQMDMDAYRLPSAQLRIEVERGGELAHLLLRYAQMVLVELAQLVLCNRAHSLEERAARWILQINDRLGGDGPPFDATQEFVASMLGATRPHLTAVMQEFREQDLIAYRRGNMQVLDAAGLEARACACYRTIRAELDRLLAAGEHGVGAKP